MKHPLGEMTIRRVHEGLVRKEFSALELTQGFFAHIKARDPEVGAYLNLNEEGAARAAEITDLKLAEGESIGMLAGVPVALKDNMLVKGEITTAGSNILKGYKGSYNATVVQKLNEAGAVILGKTNLDEFAMGSSTENSGFHITKNPHDLTRVPGGSSGGSTAAVAAHMAVAALGSDTGGSIRQPAAFCGVVGLKPTYGAVSRSGLIAMASSLDQIGPITKTVDDAAILFDVIRGKDPLDATSSDYDYKHLLTPSLSNVKGLRVGVPREYMEGGLAPEVTDAILRAEARLKSLGVEFVEISLPHTQYALSCYYIVMPAEVSSNLARFDGVRYERAEGAKTLSEVYLKTRGEGFGGEVTRRIILGTFVLSSGYYDAYYHKAQAVRACIKKDFDEAFKKVDMIFAPTTPTTAFKIGEKSNDPLSMYLSDIFTIPVNLAGLPALSLPVEPNMPLPIGFQLIGKSFGEEAILNLGHYYEQLTATS